MNEKKIIDPNATRECLIARINELEADNETLTAKMQSSATVSMEAQSSVVVGLTDKGLQMKDCKIYGASVEDIFSNQRQAITYFLSMKADYAAGKFNPEAAVDNG